MNFTESFRRPSTSLERRPWASLACLLGFGLASLALACGGEDDASEGDGNQNADGVTESEQGDPSSSDQLPPNQSEGLPVDPNGSAAGGTSLNLFELLETDECNSGWLPDDPPEGATCNATFSGACFESNEDACTCAGCPDACDVAESFPTQVFCRSVPLGCDYQVFDACYDNAEDACAAANCAEGQCTILESYPMRPICEE